MPSDNSASNQPITVQAQRMDSSGDVIIPVNSSEGPRGEAESNQLNSEHELDLDPYINSRAALKESLQRQLGIVNITSIRANLVRMLQVPWYIKELNPDPYKPRLISVGPLHYHRPELSPMRKLKRRYAHNFITRFSIDVDALIEVTKKNEEALRRNYELDSSHWNSDEYVIMMCIDAAFLLEFLLIEPHPGSFDGKWNNVISDLFLLENQIPFYYLSELLALTPYDKQVLELCDNLLDNIRSFDIGRHENKPSQGEKHLLDRLRTRMAPTTNGNAPEICEDLCPTISQLHRAGIKFRPTKTKSFELTFRRGILEIPWFAIDQNIEKYFANLVVSELFANDCYASDYIAIMEYLIDGPEDVRILVEEGVLSNDLEDDKAAASLINEIGRSINVSRNFHYTSLVKGLNAHYKKVQMSPWLRHRFEWKVVLKTAYSESMRELKTNYFSNPWKTLSVIAAVILLALTFTQTVFSFLQLKGVGNK